MQGNNVIAIGGAILTQPGASGAVRNIHRLLRLLWFCLKDVHLSTKTINSNFHSWKLTKNEQ